MSKREDTRLKVVRYDDMSCEILLSRCNVSLANEFRKVMVSEVPTMAFDVIVIQINETPISDDFFAHRLGLVPLVSSYANKFVDKDKCTCSNGCDRCSVEWEIDMQCPYNKEEVLVTNESFKFVRGQTDINGDPLVAPVLYKSDFQILNRLTRSKRLKLRAIAYKGYGKQNAKFSPCNVKLSYARLDTPPNYLSFGKYSVGRKRNISDLLKIIRPVVGTDDQIKDRVESAGTVLLDFKDESAYQYTLEVECLGQLKSLEILNNAIDLILEKLTVD